MWSIGFSIYTTKFDHSDLSTGSIALLPSSIQLLRCTAEAVHGRGARLRHRSSVPLVGGLPLERTDQGIVFCVGVW